MSSGPAPSESAPKLRRETHPHREGPWALQHLAGLIALAIGLIGFLVVALSQHQLWSNPDWRIALPFLVGSFIAGCASVARREGMWVLPAVGVGLAAAAL